MSRLAFLSPLPPSPTGIADYAVDVLHLLAPRHAIDVFHAGEEVEPGRVPESCAVFPAGAFVDRHRQRPYDLAVYQLGNGLTHAFLYEALARVPGLLVLHDLVLHHSRAWMLMDTPEAQAYLAEPWSALRRDAARGAVAAYETELVHNYPAQAARLRDVHLSTVGDLLPYAYPLFRRPVEASRVTAVHNGFMAEAIREEVPAARVLRVAMPVTAASATAADVAALRARYGIAPDALVVGSFGLLTREKQAGTVLRAVARVASWRPDLRLALVGPVADREALSRAVAAAGLSDRCVITGHVPFAELGAHMEMADIVVHLRYPTARETSAALLRVLAQGRPTVMSDLEHLSDIPEDAVLRADPADEEGDVTRALLRLADSPALRAALGRRAAAYAAAAHAPGRCRDDYEAAIEAALRPPR